MIAFSELYGDFRQAPLGSRLLDSQELCQHTTLIRNQGDLAVPCANPFHLQHLKQGLEHLRVSGNVLQRCTDDLRPHGPGFAKFYGCLAFCRAGDDAHLIGPILLDS